MPERSELRPSNPFATRFIAAGTQDFVFSHGDCLEDLVDQLRDQNWWGEIIGPHGSGKSTLLIQLLASCAARGRKTVRVTLHNGQRRLPDDILPESAWDEHTLVAVDGYEQLGRWQRYRLQQQCRRRTAGLLVTTHQPTGLPLLYRTSPSLDLFRLLVDRLLDGSPVADTLSEDAIHAAFDQQQGNLREAFLQLYDEVQSPQNGHA